jgi:peptidoglycan/LPS O-acetylase OafA/YrhL
MQFNKEVLMGTFVATWLIPNVSNNSSKFDDWLGNMSYGIFLNHVLVATLMEEYSPQLRARITGAAILLTVSLILSQISFYSVEKKSLIFRHRLRQSWK